MQSSVQQPRHKRAFTLIEIMVATVIMVIMVGLVIQITSEVLKVWNRSTGKLSANAEARMALDLLTSDLETAVFRNNGLQWLRAEKGTEASLGTNTVALRLFAPAMDRDPNAPGDICAIAYQLENRDPVDGATAPGTPDDRLWILYRLLVGPEETFNDLMGEGVQNSLPDKAATAWSAASIVGASGENYLARNVVEFDIDFYVEDDGDSSTPSSDNFVDPKKVAGVIYGGSDATVGSGVGGDYGRPLAYADIKLTIVSDEGAALLQNISSGYINEDAEDVIRQHGEVFIRRVHFAARAL